MDALYPLNTAVRDSILWNLKFNYKVPDDVIIRSLVMVSGGLDSVALIANLLTHTNHEVHAHHVDNVNKENRDIAEDIAIERCLAYLRKNYRHFTYSSTRFEMLVGDGKRIGMDISLVMFIASRVNFALTNQNNFVWTGHMSMTPVNEYIEGGAVFAAATYNLPKPGWVLPYLRCNKLDVYASIPPELADMTWSCRTPAYDQDNIPLRCGECHACVTRNQILVDVERIKNEQKSNP